MANSKSNMYFHPTGKMGPGVPFSISLQHVPETLRTLKTFHDYTKKNIEKHYHDYDYYVMVHAPRAKIMGIFSVFLGTRQVLRAQEMLVRQTRREELETQRFQLEESMKVLSHKVATQSDRWLRCIQT